jgi:hypothetical protein
VSTAQPSRSAAVRITFLGVAGILVLLGAPSRARTQLGRVPINLRIEGCVQPAPDCKAGPDVIPLDVQGEKVPLAIVKMSIFTGHRSTGGLIDDMKFRGMRTFGPDAVRENFAPGAHVQINAVALMDTRMLLVQSVERERENAP